MIADSRALAKDAAELVQVDYEPLPAVSDVEAALGDDAPILHDDLGTNHCYTWKLEAGESERLFAEAAVTVKERYYQNRLIPNAIEPRGVIVQPVPDSGRVHDVVGDPDPAHPPHDPHARHRHPRGEAARSSPRTSAAGSARS